MAGPQRPPRLRLLPNRQRQDRIPTGLLGPAVVRTAARLGTGLVTYGPAEFQRDLPFHVPRETIDRLETHRRLLQDWSGRMNLVGPKELEAFWQRHALDSAQLVALAPQAKRWADLGSGAGFPGLVVAAFVAGQPGASVHLVESTGKKAAFLRRSE